MAVVGSVITSPEQGLDLAVIQKSAGVGASIRRLGLRLLITECMARYVHGANQTVASS